MSVAKQNVQMLMHILQVVINFIGVLFLALMGIMVYMSAHIIEEEKRGKHIPLPWEKKQ